MQWPVSEVATMYTDIDYEEEKRKREERQWPLWFYLLLFLAPAIIASYIMIGPLNQESLFAGIVALAVMNGSINSVIAYMTIQLDTKSSESLQHLENINNEMDKLEKVLDEANQKVTSFTSDLDEAKGLFQKVGVDLRDLDLEPVAEVVEKLKENKTGLNSVLDNMRSVDVEDYIQQAKRIDWKQLMNAAEEIMGFIQKRSDTPAVTTQDIMSNISLTDSNDDWFQEPTEEFGFDEDEEEDFDIDFDEDDEDDEEFFTTQEDEFEEPELETEPEPEPAPKLVRRPTLKRRR
tara:strand:+ start:608 stop:1480 length:873 start_codon:yes stop_codon:yes gene_type:complete